LAIKATLELRIKPGALDQAPDVLHKILTDTRAFDGNLGVEVLIDERDPEHIVVLESWESLAHDDAYRAWRAGDGASNLGTILAAPPTLTRFTSSDI
jgi:heme oxygenase (mycobilin-producing)